MIRSMSAAMMLLALLITPGLVDAQLQPPSGASPRVPERVPVIVALVDALPAPGAPFALLRRPRADGGDVILLRTDADAHLLSDAVRALLAVRGTQGDDAAEEAVLRVTRPAQRRPALPWAARVLADIRRSPPEALAGVGAVRSVQIWLPPHRNAHGRR